MELFVVGGEGSERNCDDVLEVLGGSGINAGGKQ